MIDLYLIPLKDIVCFEGTVSADPSEPYMTISYVDGVTGTSSVYGTSGAPIVGNTVEFSKPNGAVIGRVRLRSWSGTVPTGNLDIAENDDISPLVKAGDTVRVYQRFDLFAISPRPVKTGDSVVWYEDYDIAYSDQTDNYPPVAVAGLPAVGFLEGGSTVLHFYGEKSFAVKDGAGIASWLWTAHGSVEGTSANEGTYLSPVTFTFTEPGQHLVSLKVTDTNGKTHAAYTWAFVLDADNPEPIAFTHVTDYNDSQDYNNGGGTASVKVHFAADSHVFTDNGMVVVAARGELTGGTHPALDRDNVLFVGYIKSGTLSYSYKRSEISFSLQTIDGVLRQTKTFPVSIRNVQTPNTWLEARRLMVDKAAVHFLRWRTTALQLTPFQGMGYTAFIARQDFSGGDAYSEVDRIYRDAWGHLAGDARGWLTAERDYQLMTTGSERVLTETGVELSSDDWINTLAITEVSSFGWQVSRIDMSGVYYNGVDEPTPYFSAAPGEVPKSFGRNEEQSGLILTSQDDLNVRCGLYLAKSNMKYPRIVGVFMNDVRFFVSPQRRFTLHIKPEDNVRGLSWDAMVIPRKVSRRYVPDGGYFLATVEFEPDASGQPGVTVTMPSTAPTPGGGNETLSSGTVSLVAAASLHLMGDTGSWYDSGVTGSVHAVMADPYAGVNGVPPSLWYGGAGMLRWTENPSGTYTNILPTGSPVNVWGDTSVPSFGNVNFTHFAADVRGQGKILAVAQWDDTTSGYHRFEILQSDDGGMNWHDFYWWLAGGISPSDVHGVYTAVGADDYADSLKNRNNPGTNDLTTGSAPVWDASTGWTFDGSGQYLLTNKSPGSSPFTVIALFGDSTTYGIAIGATNGTTDMLFDIDNTSSIHIPKVGYGIIVSTSVMVGGYVHSVGLVVANSEQRQYSETGNVASAGTGIPTLPCNNSIAVGGKYDGSGIASPFYGIIKAVAIYDVALTDAQAAAVAAAMFKLE